VFHDISPRVLERMRELEALDAHDRAAGRPRMERLRQIPPETGRFLALLLASAPRGEVIEIGTSGGYSALWLSLACRAVGRRMRTFELLEEKARIARETFARAGVQDVVELVVGDARAHLASLADVAFCFLDAEKDEYSECYDAVVPKLVPGALLVADNAISHAADLGATIDRALADDRVDALVVPIGKGELVCRKL
jgi:predicted O-methyltransferase YrrM